jgi:hypothetical protein
MTDDVLANAVHPQPAPNINKNDIKESQGLVGNNDATKMEEDNSSNKVLLKVKPYGKTSTEKNAGTFSAITTINSNNNFNECPLTPYTSNTTNNKASIQSYFEKTPTNTSSASSDDMVIDAPTTPKPPPDRSPTTKRYFHRKTPQSQQTQLPSTNVPPIRPFTLGQIINMLSLSTAVKAAQAETTEERSITETAEQDDIKSASSMDTSDVSKILKPISIFNPYTKQHRNTIQKPDTPGNTTKRTDYDLVATSVVTNISNTKDNTHNLAYDRAPLIPTYANSTNPNEQTSVKTNEHTQNNHETTITELSQE